MKKEYIAPEALVEVLKVTDTTNSEEDTIIKFDPSALGEYEEY